MTAEPSAAELQRLLDFAIEAAHQAGALTLGYFNAGVAHEQKADLSPVTVADRGAEQLLRQRITAAFPTHAILGEEFGAQPGSAPARWILDPIDGTFSFIHGVPLYSVLIGFEYAGTLLAGVIHMPALSETVYAARGLGCRCNGRPARVSPADDLAAATVLTGGGKGFDATGHSAAYERLRRGFGNHRGWCDGYGYALVATGRAEACVDPRMQIWDIAAVAPVIREAGGVMTAWDGTDVGAAQDAIATNGRLHAQALALLHGGEPAAQTFV